MPYAGQVLLAKDLYDIVSHVNDVGLHTVFDEFADAAGIVFERKKEENKTKAQGTKDSTKVPSGGRNTGDDSDNEGEDGQEQEAKDFKTSNFKIGDNIGLHRFIIRFEKNKFKDPKTGQYIQKDRGINSGVGSHGGSYWKLFESEKGKQIGTITQDGYWLRN